MELAPTLMDQIKEAQKGHESIDGIKKKIPLDKALGFSVDAEGFLSYHGRVCVPDVMELKGFPRRRSPPSRRLPCRLALPRPNARA